MLIEFFEMSEICVKIANNDYVRIMIFRDTSYLGIKIFNKIHEFQYMNVGTRLDNINHGLIQYLHSRNSIFRSSCDTRHCNCITIGSTCIRQ